MVREPGPFDLDERCRKPSEVGDPPVRLCQLVDFEVFRSALTKALSSGGRARLVVSFFMSTTAPTLACA